MQLDKLGFQQGEVVNVHLFLKNIGSQTINLTFSYRNDLVGFIVKANSNKEVYIFPISFLTALGHAELKPGDEIEGDNMSSGLAPKEWDQKVNIPSDERYGLQVPPGKYKIIGRTGVLSIVGNPSFQPDRIETTAITITIT
jgi:hypothetical protein